MTHPRFRAWVRVLCAVALGLGLSGTASAAIAESTHVRPAVAQLQNAANNVAGVAVRAPLAVRHAGGRHVPPTVGAALLVAAALVSGLALASRRQPHSSTGGGRRTTPAGARAPPVAIGI